MTIKTTTSEVTKMKTADPLCQGDVTLIRIDTMPDALIESPRDKRGRIVLREGEATGHAHRIESPAATLFVQDDLDEMADRFLRVASEVELLHEEHGTVTIPPGDYIVRGQREYDPFAQQAIRVMD